MPEPPPVPGRDMRPGAKTGPCRYPDRIRPSLESLGFDIGKTASELLGIELKWSEPGSSGLPEYFTLVSGFFSSRPANDGSW